MVEGGEIPFIQQILIVIKCLLSQALLQQQQEKTIPMLWWSLSLQAWLPCLAVPSHPTTLEPFPYPLSPMSSSSDQTRLRPWCLFIPTSEPSSHQLALVFHFANSCSPLKAHLWKDFPAWQPLCYCPLLHLASLLEFEPHKGKTCILECLLLLSHVSRVRLCVTP